MKTILRIVLLCLYVVGPIQASQALWSKITWDTPTIDEGENPVGTLQDFYVAENEDGDGPYLTYRIKVTMADSQEIFLSPMLDMYLFDMNEQGSYTQMPGNAGEAVSEDFNQVGTQFNLGGNMTDYAGSIFTLEVGFQNWDDNSTVTEYGWYAGDFNKIGYASASYDELSDGIYTFFDIGPNYVRPWMPSIIVDSPVPEPSVTLLVILGICAILKNRRNQSF